MFFIERQRERINLHVHSSLANGFRIIVSHPNYNFAKKEKRKKGQSMNPEQDKERDRR